MTTRLFYMPRETECLYIFQSMSGGGQHAKAVQERVSVNKEWKFCASKRRLFLKHLVAVSLAGDLWVWYVDN